MDGGTTPASAPPVRRERKKWAKEPNISLYVNEAELSKWTSGRSSDPPPSKPPPTSSSTSSSPSSPSVLQKSSPSSTITKPLPTSSPASSPTLQRSLSKSTLNKSTSSPKPTRATKPQTPRLPSPRRPPSSPSRPAVAPAIPVYPPSPAPLAKQRERFKSPLKTPAPPKVSETPEKPAAPSKPTPSSSPKPAHSSSIIASSPSITTASSSIATSPSITASSISSSPSFSPPTHSEKSSGKQELSDKSKIVNFMCGVLKIFAHLAGLPEGAEKQKEVKLAALEKRCKERLPPGLCMSILDVLNDFRFLNALYDLPDQLDDIKATTLEFEKKVNQFVSIVSAKFGGMDLMREQSAVLMGNSTKKIQISAIFNSLTFYY